MIQHLNKSDLYGRETKDKVAIGTEVSVTDFSPERELFDFLKVLQ